MIKATTISITAPDDAGPLKLRPDAVVTLDKPGCFDHGMRARVRRYLPYTKVYALRLGDRGGIVFARPEQLVLG